MSKEHINLPKTAFSMKAGLPIKEPGIVKPNALVLIKSLLFII